MQEVILFGPIPEEQFRLLPALEYQAEPELSGGRRERVWNLQKKPKICR
jgi:hypothetical protein